MPNIVIREIDETSAGGTASSTDIVYVPGIADTNANCYIYTDAGVGPQQTTDGTLFAPGHTIDSHLAGDNPPPSIACNTTDRKTWYCTFRESIGGAVSATWTLQEQYIEPHPENSPTLCKNISDFEAYFGKAPYQFTVAQAYTAGSWDSDAIITGGKMYEANDYERSYIYAKELVKLGIPVLYENIVSRQDNRKNVPTIQTVYNKLSDCFDALEDKGEYDVKYITSGGYPVFEYTAAQLAQKMCTVAYDRGDCLAIIDHTNKVSRTLKPTEQASVYAKVKAANLEHGEFATMFTPWASYSCTTAPVGAQVQQMPASLGYLLALGKSVKTNANWLAIAGVARGQVPYIQNLNTSDKLSNAIAEAYQPRNDISINAITNIRPYGLTIWGNRTLLNNADKQNLVALSFLNTRNLVSDVKKVAYDAARSLQFEQDSNILWLNFKSKITPLLDKMQSGYGISGYKIIRGTTSEKAKVVAIIRLYPTYAVEDFDITVVMSDDEIAVS